MVLKKNLNYLLFYSPLNFKIVHENMDLCISLTYFEKRVRNMRMTAMLFSNSALEKQYILKLLGNNICGSL